MISRIRFEWLLSLTWMLALACDLERTNDAKPENIEPQSNSEIVRSAKTQLRPSVDPQKTEGQKAKTKTLVLSPLTPEGKFYGPPRLTTQRLQGSGKQNKALAQEKLKDTALASVCQDRNPCRQLSLDEAGQGPHGETLQVLSVSLREEGLERDYGTPDCEPIEHWLVSSTGRTLTRAELLLDLCNDGYGASGVGEDLVEVSPGHIRHRQYGGSNHRWSDDVTLQLFPRKIAAWASGTMISSAPPRSDTNWDFRSFSGDVAVVEVPCSESGDAPDGMGRGDSPELAWAKIPTVKTSPSYSQGGWRQVSLGQCSARIEDGGAGYVIHGERAGKTDNSMRVVGLEDGSFVVQVKDDKFVLEAERAIFEDHFEIWTSNEKGPDGTAFCVPPRKAKPSQWGIRLKDGSVFSGYGSPPPSSIRAEVQRSGDSYLVRLFPKNQTELVTIVYSDSDDGKTQKSLVATSALKAGVARTLGAREWIHPAAAVCEVTSGRLEPVLQ